MIVFVLCFSSILMVMYNYVSRRNLAELEDRAMFIASLVNCEGWEFLKQNSIDSEIRTTIVQSDGQVLFDSKLDVKQMENHSDREEIQEALEEGIGESKRYSESILNKTSNYAVRLDNGDVLRVSMEEDTIFRLLLNLLNPMLLAMLLTVLLSLLLATKFSKDMMDPIDKIDLENPDDRDVYDEMKPFIRRIVSQNQQIYRQMNELREENKKQDAMRREFTANVSHELKTPLTSISGFAEIIRDGMVQEKDLPHFADTIYQEAQRLIVLVNDILKLSRLEDDTVKVEDEKTTVDLLELCLDVKKRLTLSAGKAHVFMECGGDHAEISGIRGTLEEIVYNVCDNAIKYNRPGGMVNICVKQLEQEVLVKVTDNGIGIPEEDRSRIFERFYRVNKSHSKEVGGTGLGLSIVKHGMELHNARITLDSDEGRGTEICLYFPCGEPLQEDA